MSNMRARFDSVAGDRRHNFTDIPIFDRLSQNRRLCGYLKVTSLLKDENEFDVHGEHDIIYLNDESDLKLLTDDDILYLARCGIFWDSENDCLAHFC